jgi:hypothetical protein
MDRTEPARIALGIVLAELDARIAGPDPPPGCRVCRLTDHLAESDVHRVMASLARLVADNFVHDSGHGQRPRHDRCRDLAAARDTVARLALDLAGEG